MSTQEIIEGTGSVTAEHLLVMAAVKFAVVAMVIFAIVILIRLIAAKIKGEDISSALFGKSGRRKINATLRGSDLKTSVHPKGFIFGKTSKRKKAYLPSDKEGHIIVFGGSGKGKTSALLIPSLRAWLGTFFAIDISGDISANVVRSNSVKVCPDDPDSSVLVNVFFSVDTAKRENTKRKKLELLTNLIVEIPPNVNETQEYFLRTARKLLKASLFAFYGLGFDFIDICKTICFNSLDELFELIEASNNSRAISIISSLKGANAKNVNGEKETLEDKIGLFANDNNME